MSSCERFFEGLNDNELKICVDHCLNNRCKDCPAYFDGGFFIDCKKACFKESKRRNDCEKLSIGDKILIKAEVSEIRSNGIIIVKTLTGDYFGVGIQAVMKDGGNRNE